MLITITFFKMNDDQLFNELNIPLLNYDIYHHDLFILRNQYILFEKKKINLVNIYRAFD